MRSPLVLLALLCACSSDGSVEVTFDPCSPLTVVPGPDTTAEELLDVQGAVDAWSAVIPTAIEVGDPPADGGPALYVTFESGDTFYRAIYWDSIGEIAVSREKLDRSDVPIALAHELGHAFGLLHVDPAERASVMNVGNVELGPTPDDAAAVQALWPACAGTL